MNQRMPEETKKPILIRFLRAVKLIVRPSPALVGFLMIVIGLSSVLVGLIVERLTDSSFPRGAAAIAAIFFGFGFLLLVVQLIPPGRIGQITFKQFFTATGSVTASGGVIALVFPYLVLAGAGLLPPVGQIFGSRREQMHIIESMEMPIPWDIKGQDIDHTGFRVVISAPQTPGVALKSPTTLTFSNVPIDTNYSGTTILELSHDEDTIQSGTIWILEQGEKSWDNENNPMPHFHDEDGDGVWEFGGGQFLVASPPDNVAETTVEGQWEGQP